MKYLLDTNILSELVKRQPDAGVDAKYRSRARDCALSAPTVHEVFHGVARMVRSARQVFFFESYEQLIKEIPHPVLSYDEAAARWHARERARLARAGLTPAFVDSQIAAIAATRNLILVTRNTRDFECFDELRLENWFGPN